DRETAEVEKEQERRRIDPAQRAVERKRRERKRSLEALRQHDLKDVAGCYVFLRARDLGLELLRSGVRGRRYSERPGRRARRLLVERPVERIDNRRQALTRARGGGRRRHAC